MLNVYSAEQLTKGLAYFVSIELPNKQVEQEDLEILPEILKEKDAERLNNLSNAPQLTKGKTLHNITKQRQEILQFSNFRNLKIVHLKLENIW